MFPCNESELERAYLRALERNERLAVILLVDAWTGLRWSELRAIRVRDFIELPMPILVVQRAEPEGVKVKVPKSGRSRRLPVADRVLPLMRGLAMGREPDDRLFVTASGIGCTRRHSSGPRPGHQSQNAAAFMTRGTRRLSLAGSRR